MAGLDAELHAPRLNTTALENPQEFFNCIIDRCKEQINVMLPCRIERYDRATHIADLRVLFNWKMADGAVMNGCVLKNITIRRLLAGNFIIDFPISVGDTGWIFACDRDAYDSKAESKPRLPPTPYCNSYASGFWLPDQWGSDTKLGILGITRDSQGQPVDESGRLVIEYKDGTQKISIGNRDVRLRTNALSENVPTYTEDDVIKGGTKSIDVGVKTYLTSPQVEVTANTSVKVTSPEIEIISPSVKITGDVEITGNLNVSTSIKQTGNNVTLEGHTHKYWKYDGQTGSTSHTSIPEKDT